MMWDSVSNYTRVLEKTKYFDKNYCEKYGFRLRSLFYNENYLNLHNSSPINDLSFIGAVHSDRLEILDAIKKQNPDKNYDYFMYIQSPLVFWTEKLTDKAFMKKVKSAFEISSLSSGKYYKKILLILSI